MTEESGRSAAGNGSPGAGSHEDDFDGLDLTREASLRLSDGWAGFDDEALYLVRDGERTRVGFETVTEVTFRDYDYFLVVLSVTLVGFGIWFVPRTPASLLFSLAGLASLYRLHRHRNEVVVRVRGRSKPLRFHPETGGEFYDALGRAMDAEVVSGRETLLR